MLMIFILFYSCSSSPESPTSGEDAATDTSRYIPKNAPTATDKKRTRIDTVEISDMKFQPQEIIVQKGDTVMWINKDFVVHCVTEAHNMNWTSHQIPAGGSWKKAVTENGDYYCAIHQVMKGKIVLASPEP